MYRPSGSGVPGAFVDVHSTIRGLTQDFCTSFNTGNYDHAASLFASDAILMLPHRDTVQGGKAIERVFREYGESGYENLRFETIRVDYSGDMALEIGRYTLALQSQEGRIVSDRGHFVRAWRRLGAWLIMADCWSSSLPLVAQKINVGNDTKVA